MTPGLGTLLRHLIELLDGDLERIYAAMEIDYRPRYTPVYRVLLAQKAATIGDIAVQAGVSHSAASQTVAHMAKHGLVKLSPGLDRRQHLIKLTRKGAAIRGKVERQWAVASAAAEQLDRELSMPLSQLLQEAIQALEHTPFQSRLEAAASESPAAKERAA